MFWLAWGLRVAGASGYRTGAARALEAERKKWHGLWKAELIHNREGRLLPEEVIALRGQLAHHSRLFGDRHIEITVIGLEQERTGFLAGLTKCLCSDEEIAAWQKGVIFADPWPTQLRVMA